MLSYRTEVNSCIYSCARWVEQVIEVAQFRNLDPIILGAEFARHDIPLFTNPVHRA